jgi:hypothetical protein
VNCNAVPPSSPCRHLRFVEPRPDVVGEEYECECNERDGDDDDVRKALPVTTRRARQPTVTRYLFAFIVICYIIRLLSSPPLRGNCLSLLEMFSRVWMWMMMV